MLLCIHTKLVLARRCVVGCRCSRRQYFWVRFLLSYLCTLCVLHWFWHLRLVLIIEFDANVRYFGGRQIDKIYGSWFGFQYVCQQLFLFAYSYERFCVADVFRKVEIDSTIARSPNKRTSLLNYSLCDKNDCFVRGAHRNSIKRWITTKQHLIWQNCVAAPLLLKFIH